jgi:predicted RNA-binding Zn-ribbon protein involved in translation (DUF1610 family)
VPEEYMGILRKKQTPSDCFNRISEAMNGIDTIRYMMDATPKGKAYDADWDANRKRAGLHLDEAWASLGAALTTLNMAKFTETNGELLESGFGELQALRKEIAQSINRGTAGPAIASSLSLQRKDTTKIEDRNYPVKRVCPHCGDSEARLMPPLDDYSQYECPRCGVYRVSGTMEHQIEKGVIDPKVAHIEQRDGYRCLV